jgi:hypothetical protein
VVINPNEETEKAPENKPSEYPRRSREPRPEGPDPVEPSREDNPKRIEDPRPIGNEPH